MGSGSQHFIVHPFASTLTVPLGLHLSRVRCRSKHSRSPGHIPAELSLWLTPPLLLHAGGILSFVFHPKQGCNKAGNYTRAAQKGRERGLSTKLNFGGKYCLTPLVVSAAGEKEERD